MNRLRSQSRVPEGHHAVTVPKAPPLTVIFIGSRLERREDGRLGVVRSADVAAADR
jgi:hypothetical protein